MIRFWHIAISTMVRSLIPILLLTLICMAMAGCRKDPLIGGYGFPRMAHIELGVDSACIQAPNVFTPDGDGINDVFFVHARNVVQITVRILDAEDQEIMAYNDPLTVWNGLEPAGTGPFTVQVQAETTSGNTLTGQAPLTILGYGDNPCLGYDGTPVCGDQLDPRLCGPVHATNEVFCP